MFQRETKPSGTDYTICRARTSMANCWQDLFELNGSNYPLVVDYLSAFVEIAKLNNTSSAPIVNNLKFIFARHGIPEIVVTDNGP